LRDSAGITPDFAALNATPDHPAWADRISAGVRSDRTDLWFPARVVDTWSVDIPLTAPRPPGDAARLPLLGLLGDERLARLVAGNRGEDAFALIYERYHQPLYRYCRSMLRHEGDAQDALQSAFAAAFAALRGGRRDAPLRPWLFRIVHNEAISLIRRRRPESALPDNAEGSTATLEEYVEGRERLRLLMADLGALPERQRQTLVLKELSGLSHEEIAAVLETSVGVAKQTLFEARRSLTEFSLGRAMACEEVCRAISDDPRYAIRRRRIRAHLRGCGACAEFAAGIETRRAELHALFPALPALAATGLLARLLGGGSGHGGGGTGGVASATTGKTLGLIASAKTAAAIGVVATATAGVAAGLATSRASQPAVRSRPQVLVSPARVRNATPSSPAAFGAHPGSAPARSHGSRPQSRSISHRATHGRPASTATRSHPGAPSHPTAPAARSHHTSGSPASSGARASRGDGTHPGRSASFSHGSSRAAGGATSAAHSASPSTGTRPAHPSATRTTPTRAARPTTRRASPPSRRATPTSTAAQSSAATATQPTHSASPSSLALTSTATTPAGSSAGTR
jgi:RNA polymerase sigma factor (sigma-70 family)